MDVALTANAGLIVTFQNGRRVLIDALHRIRTRFSPVSPEMIERVMATPADILLFTHAHKDHYDEKLAARYMEKHPDTVLVSAVPCLTADSARQRAMKNGAGSFVEEDVEIEYIRLQHAGKAYTNVPNYGFTVRTGKESIGVLGDAAMEEVRHGLVALTSERPLQVAAVNFPVLATRRGTEALQGLPVKNLLGIHLPFAQDDVEEYRRSAKRAAPRTAEKTGIPVTLLLEEGQQVHIA